MYAARPDLSHPPVFWPIAIRALRVPRSAEKISTGGKYLLIESHHVGVGTGKSYVYTIESLQIMYSNQV